MTKFKQLYLPILVSVAMNTGNVYASAAAGNDPHDGTCATSFSSSSSTASVKVPAGLKDEQISAMTDAQINALVTKISPFQMAGHLTEEEQALAKAAQASGQGKEYAPLKEHQLRMISTYVDQILADRGSEPAEFAASAQSIKDFIQKLLPQVSTIPSKVISAVRDKALFLANGCNTNEKNLGTFLTAISADSSGTKVDPLKVEIAKIPPYMDMSVIGIFFGYTACMDAWWNNTPIAMMAVNPKEIGPYQEPFNFYHHDITNHNMEADPQKYVKVMAKSKIFYLKKPSQEVIALAVTQSYAQYKMFSSIVRRYIRAVKVDLIKAFSQAEAISDKYARLAAKESARKYFNTRIGGLFWATHEERNSMERTMGRANFKDALDDLFAHRNFASAFGNQLDVILKEANTLLKTCNVSSVSDTGIQELLQITHMDMLNTLPKDLMLQYDVLVAKNANEWDLHIASLGDSALHDKSSNPFFR